MGVESARLIMSGLSLRFLLGSLSGALQQMGSGDPRDPRIQSRAPFAPVSVYTAGVTTGRSRF